MPVKEFRSAIRTAFAQSTQAAKQNKGSTGSRGSKGKPSG